MMEGFRRHDLVWLDPDMDKAGLSASAEDAQAIDDWLRQNWPFVVARQSDSSSIQAGRMQLGFSLPAAPARKRVGVQVQQANIISYSRPLMLKDAIEYAPVEWREALAAIVAICNSHETTPRVYGSLSAQAFTGQTYLDAGSDVDVLFECGKNTNVQQLLAALASSAQQGMRMDGEVLLPTGWAVAWRELATAMGGTGQDKVLAKSYTEARLLTLQELLGQKVTRAD